MIVRHPYNYNSDDVSIETGLACLDKTRAQQHQKEESDINTIVKRFGLTGQLPSDIRAPQYGDFTGVTDYQSALNQVIEAEKSFMAMPAEIRKRFNNNPQDFVEFCSDERNREEAIKLGLVFKKERAEPEPALPVAASVVKKGDAQQGAS